MSLLAKLGIFVGILAIVGLALWLACHFAEQQGYTEGQSAEKKLWDASNAAIAAKAEKNYDLTSFKLAPVEKQAETQVAAASSAVTPEVQTIVRIVHEQPTYASYSRPAAVEQLRHDDLSDLATLAAQSAAAASSSTGSMPRTGQ
jgi:hypothetical protein